MKSSLVTLAFFLFGCVAGVSYAVDFDVHQTSVYVLYVLMLLLGINLGSNRNLRQFVLSLNFRTLLVPLATVSGTLLFSAIGGFLLSRWSIFDCMAVGSGFSYYSVSSILITQIKSPSIGVQLATELGTIALLSNIFREMTALIGAPLFRKYFGYLAPISAAGIGSSDISLAAIARCSGPEAVPVAIVHGILIYNPQIQISAESETKRSIFREKDKTKRSKKESAQHSKSRNKSFVMTSVSAL